MERRAHTIVQGETGSVVEVKGYLLRLSGLPSVQINDVIINSAGKRALVTALHGDGIEALQLDQGDPVVGDHFLLHSQGIQCPLGDGLLGRVVNALGDPLDGKGTISGERESVELEERASDMSTRALLTEQFHTGVAAVDVLLPIAKGQRQLVVGPITSGKTYFMQSVVSHLKDTPVITIYACIGRPFTYVSGLVSDLFAEGNAKKIISVVSLSDEPAPLIYITPTIAFAIADAFSKKGKDVLLILDDFGTHAKYLREIALLSGRIPGRESYPGDMFYQHARLLERGGYFNAAAGGGSITVFPMLETNIEDTTNLISTNLMSATDGHLFFSPELNAEGYFPPILTQQSITRVGKATLNGLIKQLSLRTQALLAEYEEQRNFGRFGAELSEQTRRTIVRGEMMRTLLKQDPFAPSKREGHLILLALVFAGFFDSHDTAYIERNRERLMRALEFDAALAPLSASLRRGTLSLDEFTKTLETFFPHLEALCQQA